VITIMGANNAFAAYAGPGHWNDPDMLEVGNGGMTDIEYKTHFTLWALMAAPLIAGNDLRNMSETTRDILTAPEVVAINQDELGVQGKRVAGYDKNHLVWSKVLSGENVRAVALKNSAEEPANITVHWDKISLPAGPARVRDLWERADLGEFINSFTATDVSPHGVVLIKIESVSE
jgi:alpha-galactosidase